MRPIPVGILGGTGVIGQHYVALLEKHPWFEIAFLGGKREQPYQEAVRERWPFSQPPPPLHIHSLDAVERAAESCSLIFSALPHDLASHYEERYAAAGLPLISNSAVHRMDEDVPLVIPEVNAEHLALITEQQKNRGWEKGYIVTKPNCTLQAFILSLTPLHRRFGVKKIHMTALQAISGAGFSGLTAYTMQDNLLTHIPGEEEKLAVELEKIWGSAPKLAAQCLRVPVSHGHLTSLSVAFENNPTEEEILKSWSSFPSLSLPSAPKQCITYLDAPQCRRDRDRENGMGITVGRLRPCPLLDWRFVSLAHNAIRGGAGGGILIAELLVSHGQKESSIHEANAALSFS